MFVGLFLVMMGYLCYFNVVKSRDMIRNSHNARLDSLAERVVRGKILDKNGKVLAQTTTSEDVWLILVILPFPIWDRNWM